MIKCFLVEKTGNSRTSPCACKDLDCKIVMTEWEWRRTDTGETTFYWPSSFGPGAMWFAEEHPHDGKFRLWDNDDGLHLIVVTPGGAWDVDSRASNCTMPEERTHRCWIRNGAVPDITVGKNGNTCGAGAGSILAGSYHGFLQNGFLT